MIINQAGQGIGAEMINASTGGAYVGTVTCYVTLNPPYGTQTIGSVGGGICTAEGNGYYSYAPAQFETNAALIAFTFVGVGAIPATIQVATLSPTQQTSLGLASVTGPALTTASGLITMAFNTIGVYDPGDSIPANEMNTAYTRLQFMVSTWTLLKQMAPVLGREVYSTVGAQGGPANPYLIGPGAQFNTTRPVDIEGAGLILGSSTYPNEVEVPRQVLTQGEYESITMKDLPNLYFTGVYYQPYTVPPTGNGAIFLWPVPTDNTNALVLYRLEPLGQFASLTTQYLWPDGYPETVMYQLAARLLTPYGIVDEGTVADVKGQAAEMLATFKRANTKFVDMQVDPMFTHDPRAGYNILTGNL